MTKNFRDWLTRIFLRTWRPFFWLAAFIFFVYAATLSSNIVYLDDNLIVTGQYEFNKNLLNAPQVFNEDVFRSLPGQGTFYRPLLRLSLMFDAQFGEENLVFLSHLTNLLLHILAIFLLFYFLLELRIGRGSAFLLTLIVGIHPLTAQTVAFIPGRNDSLLTVFVLAALFFFIKFANNHKLKYFLWHLVFFILALLAKETAVVLPLICIIYLLVFTGWRKIIANFETYLVLGVYWASLIAIWFLVRRLVLNDFIGSADYNIFLSVLHNLPVLIPTIGKIFLPLNLAVFPIFKDMSLFYGALSLSLLVIWFFISSKRNLKFIIFGFSWFLVFIILALIKPTGTVPEFSENRIYLPLFGFIFVVWGLGRIKLPAAINDKIGAEARFQKIGLIISLLITLIFSSITVYRNRYYQNGLSFWKNATETSPGSSFNYNNLGAIYYLNNDLDHAARSYRRALFLNEKEPMAHNNLGVIYLNQNSYGQAAKEFQQELAVNPNYDKALFNLGDLAYRQKDYLKAASYFKATLEANPYYYEAYERLLILQNRLR